MKRDSGIEGWGGKVGGYQNNRRRNICEIEGGGNRGGRKGRRGASE